VIKQMLTKIVLRPCDMFSRYGSCVRLRGLLGRLCIELVENTWLLSVDMGSAGDKVQVHETHAHQMHAHEIYAHRRVAFSLDMKYERMLSGNRLLAGSLA
jgi:hypothetical protein